MQRNIYRLFSSPAFIVCVAFAVRVAFLHQFFRNYLEPLPKDGIAFGYEAGAVAASIVSGRGFSSPLRMVRTGPTVWFTPIYPYLLAGVFKLFGTYTYTSNLVIRHLDIAFSALTCWPIYAIGNRTLGRKTGIAAAWVWVILPTAVYFSVYWVWDTSLAGLWMALLLAATLEVRGSTRAKPWIGYGALWAIGALINPSVLSVLPCLGLWAIWPLRHSLAEAARLAALASAIFIAGIAPWTIRNYVVFHKFIPLRSNFGLELWLGNNPEVPDGWAPFLHPNDNKEEAAKYARMTELPYMAEKQQEAFAFIRSQPGVAAEFTLRRFENNWLGLWDSPVDLWSKLPFNLKVLIATNCLFSLLAFTGVLFACRSGNETAVPFAGVMLLFPVVFYITHSSGRYRFPMDPIMLVLAVYAVAYPLSLAVRSISAKHNIEPSAPALD